MKKGFFGLIALVVLGAGSARAEPPSPEMALADATIHSAGKGKSLPAADAGPVGQAPALGQTAISAPTCNCSCTPCQTGCGSCGNRLWFTGEYLMWWFKDSPVPTPLATIAPATSTSSEPGAIGQPDTTVLLGGQNIDTHLHHGGRFTAGYWLADDKSVGVEGNYFFLYNRTVSQSFFSNGPTASPFLVNPFIDSETGEETGNFIADFGIVGSSALTISNRLRGAECNGVFNLASARNLRLDLLGGFRWLNLRENLDFMTTERAVLAPNAFDTPAGQFINTLDQFHARNNFYGGQIGARAEYLMGKFFVNATGKVALGNMHESVFVNGLSRTNTGPDFATLIPTTNTGGGIYALPTNIGLHSKDRFAVVPEVTVNFGVRFNDWTRAFVGYNFLYISDVARPGNQIDRTINGTQLPSFTGVPGGPLVGAQRPAFEFHDSSFWAQGINFGIQFSF